MNYAKRTPDIYLASGRLSMYNNRGFYVQKNTVFRYLSFSREISFRLCKITIGRNPLDEVVAGRRYVD